MKHRRYMLLVIQILSCIIESANTLVVISRQKKLDATDLIKLLSGICCVNWNVLTLIKFIDFK